MPWLGSVPIAVSNNIDEKELARLAQKVDNLHGPGTRQVAGWLRVTVTSPHRAVR